MVSTRIAVAAHCFSLPIRGVLRAAADIGATGLQFDARHDLRADDLSETGRRQFLQRLREHGLQVASLSFPTRRTLYDTEELDRRVGAIKSAMQFARELKATVVTTRIGRIPADVASAQYETLCQVLRDLAGFGNRVGATLAITPTNDSPDEIVALLSRIETGPIGVNFDPAIFVMTGHEPGDAYRTLYNVIHHVQARDGVREVDGRGLEVPLGRGDVQWDELLALVDESRFTGWTTCDRTTGDDQAGDVGRAVRYLRSVGAGG